MIAATNVQISANPPSKSEGLLNFRSEKFVNRRFPPISHTSLLRDGGVDAVVVVTPTKTHFAVVTDALHAGKHVLCEKPLCIDTAEGEQLVALAKDKGLVLIVGHIFLFNPGILKVKDLVDRGELGDVRSLTAVRTNLSPVRSDVNAAWDLASRDISIFNWLLGSEPVEVQAMGAAFLQPSIEDVVNITLRYPGNVLASIQCSWLDPKKVRQLTLVGSKKMITCDYLALSNPVAIYEKIRGGECGSHRLRPVPPPLDARRRRASAESAVRRAAEGAGRRIRPRRARRESDDLGRCILGVVKVLEKVQRELSTKNT